MCMCIIYIDIDIDISICRTYCSYLCMCICLYALLQRCKKPSHLIGRNQPVHGAELGLNGLFIWDILFPYTWGSWENRQKTRLQRQVGREAMGIQCEKSPEHRTTSAGYICWEGSASSPLWPQPPQAEIESWKSETPTSIKLSNYQISIKYQSNINQISINIQQKFIDAPV